VTSRVAANAHHRTRSRVQRVVRVVDILVALASNGEQARWSVWGRDTEAAVAVAYRLETGMVWVNEMHTLGVDAPFGGHKQSGLGIEHGNEGRQLFTNPTTVLVHK
jgi:acyl-CoA reductase-like NAD-dependent aldehyde dehydrogenase